MSLDLKRFCATAQDDYRKWLHTPFSIGEFTYATDGAIMIRVPLVAEWPAPENRKLDVHCADLFKSLGEVTFISPLPATTPSDVETSEEVECEACDGRGHDHECPDCTCTCDNCGGSGNEKKVDKISTVFHGNIYRLKYVREILALPGIEIAPDSVNEPKRVPLLFRFDSGAGVLMPRNSKCDRHVEMSAQPGVAVSSHHYQTQGE